MKLHLERDARYLYFQALLDHVKSLDYLANIQWDDIGMDEVLHYLECLRSAIQDQQNKVIAEYPNGVKEHETH